jgi:iron complex transport system substrate-binding protein
MKLISLLTRSNWLKKWQLLCGMMLIVCISPNGFAVTPITLQDDNGKTVVLNKVPQRIVSILPSLTETICALGHCKKLVGVDRYSNWPAELQKIPKVGGGLDPNIEAIVALKPDLVLAATSSKASTRLESLGIKVLLLEPKTFNDMQRVINKLGMVLGMPETEYTKVWQKINAGVKDVATKIPTSMHNTTVYFEVNRGPYAAGESSFIGETMALLHIKNIIPANLGPFPKINPELIVRSNPQIIMIGSGEAENLMERPGWSNISAIKNQRVCIFTVAQGDILVRPGPRMVEAAQLMAQCLEQKMKK